MLPQAKGSRVTSLIPRGVSEQPRADEGDEASVSERQRAKVCCLFVLLWVRK